MRELFGAVLIGLVGLIAGTAVFLALQTPIQPIQFNYRGKSAVIRMRNDLNSYIDLGDGSRIYNGKIIGDDGLTYSVSDTENCGIFGVGNRVEVE